MLKPGQVLLCRFTLRSKIASRRFPLSLRVNIDWRESSSVVVFLFFLLLYDLSRQESNYGILRPQFDTEWLSRCVASSPVKGRGFTESRGHSGWRCSKLAVQALKQFAILIFFIDFHFKFMKSSGHRSSLTNTKGSKKVNTSDKLPNYKFPICLLVGSQWKTNEKQLLVIHITMNWRWRLRIVFSYS